MKDEFISVEHFLLAATEDGAATGSIFKEFGITRERLMQALRDVRGSQRVTSQNPEATYESLEKYGRDLTKLAAQGKLDSVIGRDEEIRRVDPGAFAPHQEQSGADWRAGRGQDSNRRRTRAAHRTR